MTVHGDFSRAVAEGFNGVLYQQGRVFLDADATSQTILTTAWQDTAARDTIGAGVAAVPASERDSFRVLAANLAGGIVRLDLHAGRVWADGLLVQLAEDVTRQATYLRPPVVPTAFDESTIAAGIRDAVILEVWRDAISAYQMPQTQLEPALGGPDTTERLHTSFALKLYRLADGENCETIRDRLGDNFDAKGKLTVSRQPTTLIAGDCPVVEGGGYTGFEHNFYRIEMADLDPPSSGGATPVMFKWSQYNGGLVAQVEFNALGDRARLTGNMPAVMHSDLDSFYMEVLKLDADLGYWQVAYGANASLVGDELVPSAALKGAAPGGETVFVRLWNGIRLITDFAPNPNPTELQDGIRLEFEPNAAGRYTAGDYWTFNVYAGELFNPEILIDDSPPEGVQYHRVPLGVLEWDGSSHLDIGADTIDDCRNVFDPLTRIQTCCTYHVGDGINSHGDFTSIEAAVNALPEEGGEVCVLPGIFTENIRISRRHNIIISGCGGNARSIVRGQEGSLRPVFHLRDCQHMKILGLAIEPFEDAIGVLLEDRTALTEELEEPSGQLRDIELGDLFIRAGSQPAIETHFSLDTTIHDCTIEMYDVATTKPAVFFQGEDCLIERNVIRVRPRAEIILMGAIEQTRLSEGTVVAANLGFGGLQLAGLCERVRVLENVIQGGIYHGITLGSLRFVREDEEGEVIVGTPLPPEDPCPPGDSTVPDPPGGGGDGGGGFYVSDGPLRDIYIERNRILDMGLNGIGVVGFFAIEPSRKRPTIVSVERLTIQNNEIMRCLRRSLADIRENMLNMIGYGGIALAHVEKLLVRENLIRDNGPNQLMPICGIFVLLGEGVEIDENRIINNGIRTGESDEGARPGVRGGIAIVAALPPQENLNISHEYMRRSFEPSPAVSIHDNIVVQPLGQAIILMALGPVSVQANSLTTQGMMLRRGIQALLGATVTIINLGMSEEDFGKASFAGIASGTLSGSLLGSLAGSFAGAGGGGMLVSPSISAYRRTLPSGAVLFSDNQVLLDLGLKREEVIGRIHDIEASRDRSFATVAQPSPPFAEAVGVNLPWMLELRLTSILILSLDDLGFHDNQCFTRLASATFLTQALLFASSVRVSDNRFKEGVTDVVLSAITLGLINVTSQNEATHCMMILPANPMQTVRDPNIIVAVIAARDACVVWQRFEALFEGFKG